MLSLNLDQAILAKGFRASDTSIHGGERGMVFAIHAGAWKMRINVRWGRVKVESRALQREGASQFLTWSRWRGGGTRRAATSSAAFSGATVEAGRFGSVR